MLMIWRTTRPAIERITANPRRARESQVSVRSIPGMQVTISGSKQPTVAERFQ